MNKSREYLYWLISVPLALGLAAGIWLAFFSDLRIFRRAVSQDARKSESVNASPLPAEPIKVVVINKKDQCAFISSVEVDGKDVRLYWHNRCAAPIKYTKYTYKLKAPDGTILKSDRNYAASNEIEPNERLELSFTTVSDPRAATLEVTMESSK